jgi:hypothetical protein
MVVCFDQCVYVCALGACVWCVCRVCVCTSMGVYICVYVCCVCVVRACVFFLGCRTCVDCVYIYMCVCVDVCVCCP